MLFNGNHAKQCKPNALSSESMSNYVKQLQNLHFLSYDSMQNILEPMPFRRKRCQTLQNKSFLTGIYAGRCKTNAFSYDSEQSTAKPTLLLKSPCKTIQNDASAWTPNGSFHEAKGSDIGLPWQDAGWQAATSEFDIKIGDIKQQGLL